MKFLSFRLKVYGCVFVRDKRERDRKGIKSGNIKMESEKEKFNKEKDGERAR